MTGIVSRLQRLERLVVNMERLYKVHSCVVSELGDMETEFRGILLEIKIEMERIREEIRNEWYR